MLKNEVKWLICVWRVCADVTRENAYRVTMIQEDAT